MCGHEFEKDAALDRRTLLQGALALTVAAALTIPTAFAASAKTAGKKTAQTIELPKPGERDACPVCGMFPARYPDWVATVLYKDGHAHHFDGAKDMFKYLLDMKKYAGGHKREDIKAMGVTGYYAGKMIDARQALYVIGSDVLGPMGHELVPHPDMYDAKEFMKDHKGKGVLRFDQVNKAIVQGLDDGKFEVK